MRHAFESLTRDEFHTIEVTQERKYHAESTILDHHDQFYILADYKFYVLKNLIITKTFKLINITIICYKENCFQIENFFSLWRNVMICRIYLCGFIYCRVLN